MNYSIIFISNTTKETHIINSVDLDDSRLYYHFVDIDVSEFDEGEYTYYVVPNSEETDIDIYPNNVKKSTISGKPIEIKSTGLLRIGDYTTNNTEYNNGQQYTQYNG